MTKEELKEVEEYGQKIENDLEKQLTKKTARMFAFHQQLGYQDGLKAREKCITELERINDNLEKDRLAHIELEDRLKKDNAELSNNFKIAKDNEYEYQSLYIKAKELLGKWYGQHSEKGYTKTFYQNLLRETEQMLWNDANTVTLEYTKTTD